jgi:hypothetical protein
MAMRSSSLWREWVVVLEAAADPNSMLLDRGTTEAIVRALGAESTIALHSSERYAIQLQVTEMDMATAFEVGLSRWREVAKPLTPSGWSLIRAEVLTREELDHDVEAAQ